MTINWHVWKKPETGGVIIALLVFTLLCFGFFLKALVSFNEMKSQIANEHFKIKLLASQIKEIDQYEKLQGKEPQKYNTFKKKKWGQSLSQDLLNDSLYELQKQAKVEFLSIQFKQSVSSTRFCAVLLVKVLRDQSFFTFLQKIESELPGITHIKNFELKRARELSPQLAQKVNQGEKVSLFEGRIELEVEYA